MFICAVHTPPRLADVRTIPALGRTSAFSGAGLTIRVLAAAENGPKNKRKPW